MTVPFSIEDYVLVHQGNRKHLVSVEKTSDKMCRGVKQDNFPYDESDLTFEKDEVVANYGKSPKPFIHEAFYKEFNHKDFGRVLFFTKVSKDVKTEIEELLTTAFKKLNKAGVNHFLPVNVEVRPPKGKMLGHYKTQKHEGELDILCIRPSLENPLDFTLYHECAHGVWQRLITQRKIKASWIRDYHQFIEVQHLTSKDLKSLLNELLSATQSVSEFKAGLSENDQDILREVLSYIKKYHRLSVHDLNLLIDCGDTETITTLWPTDTIALAKIKGNGVTNYSLKNVEEYFAEVFATHMTKGNLPPRTQKLLLKTFGAV